MSIAKISMFVGVALAVAGCSVNEQGLYNVANGPQKVSETAQVSAADVQVFEGVPNEPYEIVGELKVDVNKLTAFHPNPTREAAITGLKEEAAKRGANGVINAEVGEVVITPLSWGTRKASGTAVRF